MFALIYNGLLRRKWVILLESTVQYFDNVCFLYTVFWSDTQFDTDWSRDLPPEAGLSSCKSSRVEFRSSCLKGEKTYKIFTR